MATDSYKTVRPHVVFVGCPWKTIRPKYERVFRKKTFRRRYPLVFVIVGRDGNQQAEDLFAEIKRQIDSSSCAILDVSGGKPNVALEFGYAQGVEVKTYVFVNEHKKFAHDQGTGPGAPIISDLSGVRRNPYKNEKTLAKLLRQFADQHEYTQKIGKIAGKHKLSMVERAALVSIPLSFRELGRKRRADLIQEIKTETNCSDAVAERAIEIAKRNKLIRISVGQHGYTTLRP